MIAPAWHRRRRETIHDDALVPKLKFGNREKRRRVGTNNNLVDVLAVLAQLHAEDLAQRDGLDVAYCYSREFFQLGPVGLRRDHVARPPRPRTPHAATMVRDAASAPA